MVDGPFAIVVLDEHADYGEAGMTTHWEATEVVAPFADLTEATMYERRMRSGPYVRNEVVALRAQEFR